MDSTSDPLRHSRDGDPASAWNGTSEDPKFETQIAGDYQDIVFDSDGPGVRVLDEEIDDPNMELIGNGPGRSRKNILKRGMDLPNLEDMGVENDDNLGNVLSMDVNGSAKRSRISEKQELANDDSLPTSIDALKLGLEFDRNTLHYPAAHLDGSIFLGSGSAEQGDNDEGGETNLVGSLELLANVIHEAGLGLESETKNSADNRNSDIYRSADIARVREYASRKNEYMKGRFREIAKENASRFARFAPDEKDDRSSRAPELEHQVEDCPGPFSTAMKLIKERGMRTCCVSSEANLPASVSTRNQVRIGARFSVLSLQELCLQILANNADAIVSLGGVPDALRHRLSQLLCDSRKMNSHFLELLVSGSPTEIRLRDCSWLTEEEFTKSFRMCDAANLVVLQLDQCGRCMPDYVLLATLAQSPRHLPRLTSLSLSGACRLSDGGLCALVSSTPVLRSINLSQCSLITYDSLRILADSLGSLLKELYLDDCQGIDAALIVPALKELEHLEVLSVAGIQTVCDAFIKDYIIARGHNMKELVLKDCM